jgi:hypothetical protein
MSERKFQWSDGWLLASIAYTYSHEDPNRPKTRHFIERIGDMLNAAIFTDDEIDGGVERLSEAGLAGRHDDKTFFCTDAGLALVDQFEVQVPSMRGHMIALADWMNGKGTEETLDPGP